MHVPGTFKRSIEFTTLIKKPFLSPVQRVVPLPIVLGLLTFLRAIAIYKVGRIAFAFSAAINLMRARLLIINNAGSVSFAL